MTPTGTPPCCGERNPYRDQEERPSEDRDGSPVHAGLRRGGLRNPLALDSFSLVLLQHLLEERHGIELDPEQAVLEGFASVRDIHLYLAENFPADMEAPTAA